MYHVVSQVVCDEVCSSLQTLEYGSDSMSEDDGQNRGTTI